MNLVSLVEQAVNYTGSLNPQIVIALFLACSIGEIGLSVPYLLETVWVLSGYNATTGTLPLYHLIVFWLVAQAGRQTGATAFYFSSRFGTTPLARLYFKRFPPGTVENGTMVPPLPFRFFHRINILSPFSVAFARLFWMRIPVAIALSIRRNLSVLSRGIVISSLIWDGTYILVGAIGGNRALTPLQMVLYSLTGLTALYIVTFSVQRVLRLLASRAKAKG